MFTLNGAGLFISTYYDESDDTVGGGSGDDTVSGGNDSGSQTPPKISDLMKKYNMSQEDANAFLAAERKTNKDRLARLTADLEAQKQNVKLTAAEKAKIEEQIEQLKSTYHSETELRQSETAKKLKKYESELQATAAERDTWKNRYVDSTIQSALLSAAAEGDAYSPDQVVTLLRGKTKLVDELDGDTGKPTGKLVVRVDFETTDKSGKPTVLQLAPDDAVKQMRELPEKFGNLFKSNLKNGTGSFQSEAKSGPIDFSKMSHEQYKAWKKANPEAAYGKK